MVVRLDRQIAGRLPSQPRIANPRLRRPRVGYPGVGAVRRRGRDAVALPRWMYRGYTAANAGDLAAAVAFNALIALVPTVLLLFSIAGLILRDDSVLIEAVHASVWAFTPEKAHEAIAAILEARRNTGLYGAISLIGFAWIGSNFVSCLARSMNKIYAVPNRRFVHQRPRDFAVVVVFAVLALLAAGAAIVPSLFVGRDLDFFFRAWALASARIQILSYALSIAAATALFLVLYRVVPNAGQKLRDVWPGSLTAALLFVLLVQAFPIYVRVIGGVNRYGQAFALVSLLVAWFYVLAHVLLFGTHVNATYQRHRRRARALHAARSCPV